MDLLQERAKEREWMGAEQEVAVMGELGHKEKPSTLRMLDLGKN